MRNEAPRSSNRVRARLVVGLGTDLWEQVGDRIEIWTRVDGRDRAVTTITRPCAGWPDRARNDFDRRMIATLGALPGSDKSVTITMGRTYEITWDGVCVPA